MRWKYVVDKCFGCSVSICELVQLVISISMELTAQKGNRRQGNRTSDQYIRAMGDEGSRPVSVAHVAEIP